MDYHDEYGQCNLHTLEKLWYPDLNEKFQNLLRIMLKKNCIGFKIDLEKKRAYFESEVSEPLQKVRKFY